MAKNIKLNIKNSQIAKAINLDNVRDKLEKKKALSKDHEESVEEKVELKSVKKPKEAEEKPKEEAPRMKARSQSAFGPKSGDEKIELPIEPLLEERAVIEEVIQEEPIVESPTIVEEIKEEVVEPKEIRVEVEKAPPPAPPAPKAFTTPRPYERLRTYRQTH